MVKESQRSGEQIPAAPRQPLSQLLDQDLPVCLHQAAEQVLFVGKIHVKAVSGYARLPNDPVDGNGGAWHTAIPSRPDKLSQS